MTFSIAMLAKYLLIKFISIDLEGGWGVGGVHIWPAYKRMFFFFTGSWPITKGDYKQQFTILMSVYNHTV